MKSYEHCKATSRKLLLVDQLPILFSDVVPLTTLVDNIKRVLCEMLNCEKVNIFTVDSIHKVIFFVFCDHFPGG
jgi:hypothetical protein